jgi:hypothetical protein
MPSGPPPEYNQQSYHDKVLRWRPAVEANASANNTPSSDAVSPVDAPSNSTNLPNNSTSSTSILLDPHGYDEKTPAADEHAPPQPTRATDDHNPCPLSAIPPPTTDTTPLFAAPNPSTPFDHLHLPLSVGRTRPLRTQLLSPPRRIPALFSRPSTLGPYLTHTNRLPLRRRSPFSRRCRPSRTKPMEPASRRATQRGQPVSTERSALHPAGE